MSAERLFLLDPYNDTHFELMREFETRNELPATSTEIISNIRKTIPREEYAQKRKEKNDFNEILIIIQNGKIKDSCAISGVKDRKSCTISFQPLKSKLKNRSLVTIATDYALKTLGMQEAFTIMPIENQSIMTMLEPQGYENLGIEGNTIMYLKENVLQNMAQRVI